MANSKDVKLEYFLGRIYLLNEKKEVTCKTCQEKLTGNDFSSTITSHMFSFKHVNNLQQFYVDQTNRNFYWSNLLFSLQTAQRKQLESKQELMEYFGKCISSLNLSDHKDTLKQFYYFLFTKDKELLESEDAVEFLKTKNTQVEYEAIKALLKQFSNIEQLFLDIQFSSKQNARVIRTSVVMEKKQFNMLSNEELEKCYEQYIQDLLIYKHYLIAVLFIVIRIPDIQLKNIFEIKLSQVLVPGQRVTFTQTMNSVIIPHNIAQKVGEIRNNLSISDDDYIVDEQLNQRDLNRKIVRVRNLLMKNTDNTKYKLFLKFATLLIIKSLADRLNAIHSFNTYRKKTREDSIEILIS